MNWKAIIKRMIPSPMFNSFLLKFPFLYRTKLLNYETNFQENQDIDDLLAKLEVVLDIEGDIIECGSSRCGTSIIMANYLNSKQVHKTIYACDSFEGFDRAELDRERRDGLTEILNNAFTSTSYEYVKSKIRKLGVEDIIIPIKGFFQDTLPYLKPNFCLALIDCDLRDSIIYCAEIIWPNLMDNGYVLFDDYTSKEFRGAKHGVDFFVNKYDNEILEHGLMERLYYVCKR